MQQKLTGMGIALITPFKQDESIDFDALGKLIEYQIRNGADYLVVLGTTAETPTLSDDEKREIMHFAVRKAAGRLPLVVGIGGNNTRAVIEHIRTDDLDGFDAILSACPYYNKPSQDGLYAHFKAIAQASEKPIILYNVPGRTGVNMTAETTLRLANDFRNIVAIKEASGNFSQIDDIIKNKPQHFAVSRMVRLALEGDYASARNIHHHFTELIKLLFVEGNPAGVKSMLSAMGFCENKLRLPLVPNTITTYEKIRQVLEQLNITA